MVSCFSGLVYVFPVGGCYTFKYKSAGYSPVPLTICIHVLQSRNSLKGQITPVYVMSKYSCAAY